VGGIKLWELDTKLFERMLALNLRPAFLLPRAVVGRLATLRRERAEVPGSSRWSASAVGRNPKTHSGTSASME